MRAVRFEVSHYTDHMDTAQNVNANAARKLALPGGSGTDGSDAEEGTGVAWGSWYNIGELDGL